MKKIVRLTESELVRLVKRIINEQDVDDISDVLRGYPEMIVSKFKECAKKYGITDVTKFKNCSNLVDILIRGQRNPTEKEMKDCENELVKNGFSREIGYNIFKCVQGESPLSKKLGDMF